MSFEHYLRSGTRLLRCGYTTGSCAALAAMGAASLLLTGERPETLALVTPKGLRVEICPSRCGLEGDAARCAVIKDAGDDPDVTNGIEISALVKKTEQGIEIDGGRGVGRVTKPGLDQPVGNAAINSVPRKMILAAVESVCAACGYGGGLSVIIEAGGGEEIAQKTFNPQLGIVGGISILGTSGIVEPMSEQALLDTIALEIRQAKTADHERLILAPGSYGMDFLTGKLPALKEIPRAKCSNFIGDAIDMAVLEGFSQLLLVGHIGKLVKLAGGIMNTHSKTADCRRELFCAHAALCGADRTTCGALMEEVSTDGCLAILERAGLRQAVLQSLLAAIQEHLDRRAAGALQIGALLFSNESGLLGMTGEAELILKQWRTGI